MQHSPSFFPTIVSRSEWGAEPPKPEEDGLPRGVLLDDLPKTELENVIFLWSNSDSCSNKDECMDQVNRLQHWNMFAEFFWDIKYNFLIGRDGNVYEGRGWAKAAAPLPPDLLPPGSPLIFNGLQVAFIQRDGHCDDKMKNTAAEFIAMGVVSKRIKPQAKMFVYRYGKLDPLSPDFLKLPM